jgi:uncharacterized protein (DUF2141 family)
MKVRFPLLALLLAPLSAEAASVVVTVNGIDVGKGVVKVAICDTSLSIEGCPLSGEYRAIAETQQFVFENVPDGSYGFVSYQDANSNSKFDTNVLGIPKETYGLSGPAGDKMIPAFKDTLMPVSEVTPNEVRIELRSFGERKKQNASR